jgi:hypothetical protein
MKKLKYFLRPLLLVPNMNIYGHNLVSRYIHIRISNSCRREECVNLEDELHGACFFKLWKIQILYFEKFKRIYTSVVGDLLYMCAIFLLRNTLYSVLRKNNKISSLRTKFKI